MKRTEVRRAANDDTSESAVKLDQTEKLNNTSMDAAHAGVTEAKAAGSASSDKGSPGNPMHTL